MIFIITPKISSTEIDRSSDGMKVRKSSKLQSEQSLENNSISDWPLRVLAENAIRIKDSQVKRQCIQILFVTNRDFEFAISNASPEFNNSIQFELRNNSV